MSVSDLLTDDRIAILDRPGDRESVLDAAARLLANDPDSAAEIGASLRAREQLGSTGIGHGIAIPHGRTDTFEQARGAFLRLGEPVDFGSSDGQPVDLVFVMAVPRHFTQQHLQLLSQLAGDFTDPAFRTALRDAADLDTLRTLLLGAGNERDGG